MAETTKSKLTRHQKRILAAMMFLAHDLPGPWFSRWDIGVRATGTYGNCKIGTMLALRVAGLVATESEDTLRAVREQRCRCGCDRWQIAPAGFAVANRFDVRGRTQSPRGYRPPPGKNDVMKMLGMEPAEPDAPEPLGDWNIGEDPASLDDEND